MNLMEIMKDEKNLKIELLEKLLDDLILMYDKNGKTIRNIGILPNGLKGIIYYKINNLDKLNYSVSVNISKQVASDIQKIKNDDYVTLCKCFSILLDNAIDACNDLDNRIINIDIYKENKCVIVSISNTCEKVVEIKYINAKNYSTKGKNRGLGLYIVSTLLNNSSNLNLIQENVNGYFISKLIVKNKKD